MLYQENELQVDLSKMATFFFYRKQGETRTSSGPIWVPLNNVSDSLTTAKKPGKNRGTYAARESNLRISVVLESNLCCLSIIVYHTQGWILNSFNISVCLCVKQLIHSVLKCSWLRIWSHFLLKDRSSFP